MTGVTCMEVDTSCRFLPTPAGIGGELTNPRIIHAAVSCPVHFLA